jgi:diguanylate cyclase (GGDEF)-like protein
MTRTRGPIGGDPSQRRTGTLSSRLDPDETILVVEDEYDIAQFLRAYFRASGQDVIHVDPTSPAQVAAAVRDHRPTCVLLDLNLRGFHGLAAYREIRKDEANAFVPVVVVTADQSPASRNDALEAGVTDFVTKPFDIKALCQLVREHVRNAARTAEAADTDHLTGLPSAAYLQQRLGDEITAAEEGDLPVTLVLVRMHPVPGADVVRTLAERLRTALRDEAVLARGDGDDLGVIMPATPSEHAVPALERALAEGRQDLDLALRAGVAAYPAHARTRDELYMAADAALADACDHNTTIAVAH